MTLIYSPKELASIPLVILVILPRLLCLVVIQLPATLLKVMVILGGMGMKKELPLVPMDKKRQKQNNKIVLQKNAHHQTIFCNLFCKQLDKNRFTYFFSIRARDFHGKPSKAGLAT